MNESQKQSEKLMLTEEEKTQGYKIALCRGNTYKKGCGKPYKKLNWYTPSGCTACHATFVE